MTSYANADTAHSYVLLTPENIPADGNSRARVSVVLRRQSGAPLAGVRVVLQVDNGEVSQPATVTDVEGSAEGSIAATVPGEHTVSAHLVFDNGNLPLSANSLVNVYRPAFAGSQAAVAGTVFNMIAFRPDAQNIVDPSYVGTVHLVSSDTGATLPPDYAFTPSDAGFHVFRNIVLISPGVQTVTAIDTVTQTVLRTISIEITAVPANPASKLGMTLDSQPVAGASFELQVFARDGDDAPTPAFLGTVHFSSSDPNATLPPDYTFAPADRGAHVFANATLTTAGQPALPMRHVAIPRPV